MWCASYRHAAPTQGLRLDEGRRGAATVAGFLSRFLPPNCGNDGSFRLQLVRREAWDWASSKTGKATSR
jgi:hypothetical protein